MKCVLILAIAFVSVGASGLSPVQKVTQLLADLEAKIQNDAAAEEKAYAAYADWCKNGAKDKGFEIKTTKTEIDGLTATIEKAQSDIAEHTSKVEDLGAALSSNNADLSAAK
jgi:cell division protein FtsL